MLVWHYSKGVHLPAILQSGVLRPATARIEVYEKPVLWFSSRPDFEPSARIGQLVMRDGKPVMMRNGVPLTRTCSTEETARTAGGLVRYGVDIALVRPWRELRKEIGISAAGARAMETANPDANPNQWYGIVGSLSLDYVLSIEIDQDGSGNWVPIEPRAPARLDA